MMAAWQEQVEEDWEVLSIVKAVRLRACQASTSALQEWVRWHQKEAVMAAQRAQKEREARVLLKRLGKIYCLKPWEPRPTRPTA